MVKDKRLIGRKTECDELDRVMESDRSEFVIVYGRRRVGKTFLIDRYFSGVYDFTYVGEHNMSRQRQLTSFARALKKYSGAKPDRFSDWFDAFDALEDYLEQLDAGRKKVLFIDEMPWIDTQKSDFVAALESFWNGWAARRSDIVLIACGSATSWMVDNLIENQGGLHARITCSLYIRPFTLKETELYLQSRNCKWDRYQILQCYMTFGGIPFYLSLLNVRESLVQNIDRLFFKPRGMMAVEFYELYNALFTNSGVYINVVKTLAEHHCGMTRGEISDAVGMNGGSLTRVLTNLERCDFIKRTSNYGRKSKDTIYRLVDFYTIFYYRFVANNTSGDEQWWTHNFESPKIHAWQGLTFETVCLTHTSSIKKALGISGMATSVSSWRKMPDANHHGAQVDLVIERADRIIHLCEMKFSKSEYRIADAYERQLRERMSIFAESTKTRLSPVITFVSTFGLAKGMHNSVVHSEVTMEDLY
ncbi:MAG: ATP-binding protein [Prevotella sp.]